MRDELIAARRVVGCGELPHVCVVCREARRGRAVGDDARVERAVDEEALKAVGRACVDVCLQVLRVLGERTRQSAQELVDRAVAADLTRQATLEADPLPVDILVALKLRPVALNAGRGAYLDNLFGHYPNATANTMASLPLAVIPRADCAAA